MIEQRMPFGCNYGWTDAEMVFGVVEMLNRCRLATGMIGQVFEVVEMFEQMSFGYRDDRTGVWGCGSDWTGVIWLQWWLNRGCLRCGILAVIEHMSFCCNDWTMGMARIEHAVMTVHGADWTQNKVWVWQWLNRGCHLAAMMIQQRSCVYPVAVTEWRWLKNGCFGYVKDWT